MPKIVGLDIPPGLITQYQSVLTLAFYNANPTIKKRKYPVSYAQRISFSNGSLFVKWQNLWGSFLAPRKLSWTNYWETLPFGTHSGTNGWPGSGYSAFIYVNAPRYMAGLELLLDPPSALGPELVIDGNFTNGLDDWINDWGSPQITFADGAVVFEALFNNGLIFLYQEGSLIIEAPGFSTFRITATYKSSTMYGEDAWAGTSQPYGTYLGFWAYFANGSILAVQDDSPDYQTITMDVTRPNSEYPVSFGFGVRVMQDGGPVYVTNVSCKQVL